MTTVAVVVCDSRSLLLKGLLGCMRLGSSAFIDTEDSEAKKVSQKGLSRAAVQHVGRNLLAAGTFHANDTHLFERIDYFGSRTCVLY